VAFINYKKAVDSVDRKQLLHYGLPKNINQIVRLDYENTDFADVEALSSQ